MSGKMTLTARLDQRLLMNQKLKQVIKFLQYTTIEIKEQIQELLDTNPLVELKEEDQLPEREPVMTMQYSSERKRISYSDSESDDYLNNLTGDKSLREYLIEQTLNCHFNEIEQETAIMIIDLIDEDGFIKMTNDELCEEISHKKSFVDEITLDTVNKVLSIIQTFEPVGIGSRTLKECLASQIRVKDDGSLQYQYAYKIIEIDALGLTSVDFKALERISGLTSTQLSMGLNVINTLEFHPSRAYVTQHDQVNEPEIYVKKINNKWHAFLADSILTRVEVNPLYKDLIRKNNRDKAFKSVQMQLQEANLLLNGIKRRNETLMKVAVYIVEMQQKFFEEGPVALKPINLIDAANSLEFHESTISRITTGKYIATPYGIFELKYFFPNHVTTDEGSRTSSTSVKMMIKAIIDQETTDKTYSDEDIRLMLKEKGISISRRTVTKYRESMDIPTSYLRQSVHEFNGI